MLYSEESGEEIAKKHHVARMQANKLIEQFLMHPFLNEKAMEYAHHGFGRRLQTLTRCLSNVMTLIPYDADFIPDVDLLTDFTIFVQAFLFNLFGALDNLAHLWVYEKAIKKDARVEIDRMQIGLLKKHVLVRKSLPLHVQNELIKLDLWFSHIEGYRHALAHRIPLYIPPYTIPQSKMDDYTALKLAIRQAFRSRNRDEYDRLSMLLNDIKEFRPYMSHSFGEKSPQVKVHIQLVSDLLTLNLIGDLILKAL